jgi:hypothetical protein
MINKLNISVITFVIGFFNFSFGQILLNLTIPTNDTVDQLSCNSDVVSYSVDDSTFFCYYGQYPIQPLLPYPSNDINYVYAVGHDTLSIAIGVTELFYGNATSVFNSSSNFPTNYPVFGLGTNTDLFNGQNSDTVYTLNSYNGANDQWNILRISNGSTNVVGSDFYAPFIVNYFDLDYFQVGSTRYIGIVSSIGLSIYDLGSKQYYITNLSGVTSFQYFDGAGDAYYSIGNEIYRINSIVSGIVSSTLIWTLPINQTINEFAIGQNGTIWVAANDGVYSSHTSAVSVYENSAISEVKIFPNPSNGKFKIESSVEMRNVVLSDLNGSELMMFNLNNKNNELEISVKAGIYLLKINHSNGTLNTYRISIL